MVCIRILEDDSSLGVSAISAKSSWTGVSSSKFQLWHDDEDDIVIIDDSDPAISMDEDGDDVV